MAALVAGCGVNDGFVHDATSGDQHEYRMDLSGVRYVRSVSGSASIGSIFCVGGFVPTYVHGIPLDHGLYKQAMEALQDDAKLKPNEVLKDLRTDHDPACYLFVYGVNSLTISADVYEVTPSGGAANASPTARVAEPPLPAQGKPAGRLVYSQLQEAYAQIQSNQDSSGHLGMAVRLLGNPHKIDGDSEYWWGSFPGKSDCFVLRVSATKGDSLDTAPAEKCK
ncbi:MAG TPA: hypothetical protein VGL81_07220 [Polyangiaceae bacterium]|jgi:hypothetical protein